jgi:hypothetical protein
MEIIPLISMKNRKILEKGPNFKQKLEEIGENNIIYILDIEGIETDKPNLCTFQKMSKDYEIWVDNGPRNLGDVVDVFMAGASRVTLRKNLYPQVDLSRIREISENLVFANIDFEEPDDYSAENLYYSDIDGFVNFNNRENVENNFKYNAFLKQYSSKNKLYSYESNPENVNYWKNLGVKGLLVKINKLEEFKKYDI